MNDDLKPEDMKKLDFDPQKNADAISIVRMEDGNYRGFMQKNGKLVQARQADPGTVLQLLLTSD